MSTDQSPRGMRRWMTLDEALARQGLSWADTSWLHRPDAPLQVPAREQEQRDRQWKRRAA